MAFIKSRPVTKSALDFSRYLLLKKKLTGRANKSNNHNNK